MKTLVLGTRGSALALWQARHVAGRLRRLHPGLAVEERIIKTEGDIQQQEPLGMGDRGVFVRRIEEAMLAGSIDLAVHSLKDLPTAQPDGLVIAAVPEREDARDALLSVDGRSFEELPSGCRIGTGSFRRRTQLLHARPELSTIAVRGNVDTRINKLVDRQFDALILAMAGIRRLGLDRVPQRPLSPEVCLPAVGQGALAIEAREDDARTRELVAVLEHTATRDAVVAERAFLQRLGGGCLAPAGAWARIEETTLIVEGAVGDADGTELMRDLERGERGEAAALGQRLASRMLDGGAGALLQRARDAQPDGSDPA